MLNEVAALALATFSAFTLVVDSVGPIIDWGLIMTRQISNVTILMV